MPTKTLSYGHALNTIRIMYRQAGFQVGDHTPGQQVYREFGRAVADTRLGALYALLDEQVALLRFVSWYFVSAIADGTSAEPAAAFYKLAIAHMRTLASVRILCSCGFDVNARHELRKLYENAVVWVRLRLDDAALEAFLRARTPQSANEFWHKYLAREKSEKFISLKLSDSSSWLGEWTEMVNELKRKVGPAAHPSFFAGTFDAAQDLADAGDELVLSVPHAASHFTLSNATWCAALPFSIIPEPPYGFPTRDFLQLGPPFKCIPHQSKSWEEYSTKVREMIPTLVLMTVRFSEGLRD